MRKDLFTEYNDINKYLNEKEANLEKFYYTNKILDNEENVEVLRDILTRNNELNLMISQAGSGKTYSLLKVARTLNNSLTVLAVPNRGQANQIAQEYKELNVKAVVGGVDVKNIDLTDVNILAVVYDKLEEVIGTFNIDNLILDEAQELVLATYRLKLKDIEENFKGITNILYLTATPTSLMYLSFDNVFEFCQYNKDVFPKTYEMIYVDDIKSGLVTKIKNNATNGIKTLVRLNDTEELRDSIIKDIKNIYEDLNVSYTSSKEKTFKEVDGEVVYDNEMTEYIINKSSLNDFDFAFCTSILDKGVNVNSIENGDLDKLELVYVVDKVTDAFIDNIIQFESRIRNHYFKFSIMVKKREEDERLYRSLTDLVKMENKRLLKRVDYLADMVADLEAEQFTTLEIMERINNTLNYKDINGYSDTLDNCISINTSCEVLYDEKLFFRYVYTLYNNQFYHNPELIKDFFIKEFKNSYIDKEDAKAFETTNKDEINDILEEIKTNKAILTPSIDEDNKQENMKKLNLISNSWKYKELYNLMTLGQTTEEAIDLLKDNNKSQISKIKNVLISDIIKKMSDEDYKFVLKYFKHKEDYINEDLKEINLFTYKLKKTTYYDYFTECVDRGYSLEKMIKYIKDGGSATEFLNLQQYIYINNLYISNKKAHDKEERIQYFIIEAVKKCNNGKYQHDDNVYLKISDFEEITKEINEMFKEDYTIKAIIKVIKKIFKLSDEDKEKKEEAKKKDKTKKEKEEKKYRLNGLRLK